MMGFGTGCYSLLRFQCLYLPGMKWLAAQVKAVVIVNGVITLSKTFRGMCLGKREREREKND
jgi:hypothetical protein